MTIAVRNLKYIDASNTSFDLEFSQDDGDFIPFTYVPGDQSPVSEAITELLQEGSPDIAAYVAPTLTIDDLVAHLAAVRYAREIGGITVGGISVATDDRSKIMIVGSVVAAQVDPSWTTQWKTEDGSFVTVDAATIVAIANAVSAHVGDCFSREAAIRTDIDAGTVTTFAQIESAMSAS